MTLLKMLMSDMIFTIEKEERIPFDLTYLNKITKDGLPRKTLNVILAGTGVGKSLAMCHFACTSPYY